MKCWLLGPLLLAGIACRSGTSGLGSGGTSAGNGGDPGTGGYPASGGGDAGGGATAYEAFPKYYPVPGFESCAHEEVKADCKDGWCKLPPSCFVMGSPEDEWMRGLDTENLTAVTLTHWIEIQQKELTRAEWTAITSLAPRGPDSCADPGCPVAMVSWWEAVHAANLLSVQKGYQPCYEPTGCSGTLGEDLACTGVAEPDRTVYDCDGYRLPTRAEAEYAARAGTWSTFYSGDITEYDDSTSCFIDPALEKIAWYCFNSGGRAHAGGELQPNGFGLYDIIGNLGEWNNEEQRFASSPGGVNPRGMVGTRTERHRFSPQYTSKSFNLRTASLLSAPWDGRGQNTGFRLVRTLPD
jgi:formylglycine-generating enzyme